MRLLCAQWFNIKPEFVTLGPDLPAMLKCCDAALPIGDFALSVAYVGLGLDKYDLCDEWRGLTGLPFVFAFWTGRPEALTPAHVSAIRAARDAGVAAPEALTPAHYPDDEDLAATGRLYLRQSIHDRLDDDCIAVLQKFFASAVKLGIIRQTQTVRFFDS